MDDKLIKFMDLVTELKNTQNKVISSMNSCRDSIKAQKKKIDSMFRSLSK